MRTMHLEPLPPSLHASYSELSSNLPQLPSASLLYGDEQSGVIALATQLCALLLCTNPTANRQPCGMCQSCVLLAQDANPDIFNFTQELALTDSKSISVDLVRKMMSFAYLSPSFASHKVVFIAQMSKLNNNSANALLKIIEEPPSYLKFIFVSHNLGEILPTILSRCSKFIVRPILLDSKYNDEIQQFWHGYYHQASCLPAAEPLTKEQLHLLMTTLTTPSVANIFNCTQVFDGKQVSFLFVLEFVYKWLSELAAYVNGVPLSIFANYQSQIDSLIKRLQLTDIFYLTDELTFMLQWATHPLNYKLQLENILFKYQQLFVAKGL